MGTYHSQTIWQLKNAYNHDCLYDDNINAPATYTGYSTSGAEKFIWDGLP